MRGLRRLRDWRRTRPFWAGLLLIAAGAELVAAPLAPWRVLLGLGLGGIAAAGIGCALTVAGLFLWFLPHSRQYVGIHAVILSVFSFAATNLGGFLVGMLLGIAGGAMGFAWTPVTRPPTAVPKALPGQDPSRALAAALPAVLLTTMAGPVPPRAAPAPVTAARTAPTVTASRFAPRGVVRATVADVPTASGSRKVMVLRMPAASLTGFRLRTHGGGDELSLDASELRLSGDVTLYLGRFRGCLQGVLCLSFAPGSLPVPPVVPPFVFMTDVVAEQALSTSDTITAEGLHLAARPRSRYPGRSEDPLPSAADEPPGTIAR